MTFDPRRLEGLPIGSTPASFRQGTPVFCDYIGAVDVIPPHGSLLPVAITADGNVLFTPATVNRLYTSDLATTHVDSPGVDIITKQGEGP